MKKSRLVLRIGIVIAIIGISVFFANLTAGMISSSGSSYIGIEAYGTYLQLTELRNRPIEIRITFPDDFKGVFYIFNYEGIRKLTEGTKTPTLEQAIEAPRLIDFNPDRRGAYLIIIESNVSTTMYGSLGIIEKKGISQDMLSDSIIITLIGIATAIAANIPKISKTLKKRYP